jgi:hypothetical protein
MGLTNDVMACINKTACGDEPNVKNENIAVERQQRRQRQEIEESQKKEVTKINMDDYLVPFKKKIDELCEKRDKAEPFICANGGNACNNPCYEYQTQLETKCPKCGGAVNKEFENGKTIERKYIKKNERYEDVTVYDDNVCSKFNWVKTYLKIDMNSYAAMKYFTRQKKIDDKKTAEYFCIDGEKFDAPPGQSFLIFFMKNNSYFFPQKSKDSNTIFFYENNKAELGQALGYYGHAWKHLVNIYICSKCGHKYHIIRTSPFRFRDQSLDKYIDNPEEYQKLKK